MLDTVDQQLKDWVASAAIDAQVLLRLSPEQATAPTACFHLLQVETAVPTRREGPKPVELTLSYLVTAHAPTTEEAHRLFGELLFAAMDAREYQVNLEPLTPPWWRALDMPPQPVFRLSVPLTRERVRPEHLIRQTITPRMATLKSVGGRVLGPDDQPIGNARVHVAGTSLAVRTDRRGEFVLRTAASLLHNRELHISARGHTQSVPANFDDDGAPLLIRFHPEEN